MLALTLVALLAGTADAQFKKEPESGGAKLDKELTQQIKLGVNVKAIGGPCVGLRATLPVPTDWPEQKVKILEEELSPQVKRVSYRMVGGTVKQMVVDWEKGHGWPELCAFLDRRVPTVAFPHENRGKHSRELNAADPYV